MTVSGSRCGTSPATTVADEAAPREATADVDPQVMYSYDTGRICYAESADGVHWERPHLGLVKYDGSRDNDIIDLPPGSGNMDVWYQPDTPDGRRYLMVNEYMAWRHHAGPAVDHHVRRQPGRFSLDHAAGGTRGD